MASKRTQDALHVMQLVRRLRPIQWLAIAIAALPVAALIFIAVPDLRARDAPETFGVSISGYPAIEEAVRAYYHRYEQAQANCDIETFLERYPDLAQPGPEGTGINVEQRFIPLRCEYVKAIRFDLEGYEPMRVHVHPDGMDVRVHGLEHWTYVRPPGGGGEFITTLSLREVNGTWTVVRTDEVTLAEYHDQH